MAEKRMFTKKITQTDAFLEMPLSAQCLYFHLNMDADDEGFVSSPKKVMRQIEAKEVDLQVLKVKRYILPFESGICLIKHWKLHNAIRKDRVKETDYLEEKALVSEKANGVYTDNMGTKPLLVDKLQPMVAECPPSIEEYSIVEYSIEKNNKEKIIEPKKTKTYFDNENLNELFLEFLKIRKKLKAVNSDRAITILLNKLNEHNDDTKILMLENSISNGWKGVFEVKDYNKGYNTKKDETKPKWFNNDVKKEVMSEEEQKEIEAMFDGI